MNLLRAKYKVRQNWFNQPTPSGSSPIRKSLEVTKALIAQGACLLTGNGRSIRVWKDPWVPEHLGLKPISNEGANKDIVCNGNFQITVYTSGCNDSWIWTMANSGTIFVKYAYWLSKGSFPPANGDNLRGCLWKKKKNS